MGNVWRDFKIPVSAFQRCQGRVLMANLLHDKYFKHMLVKLEENGIVRNIQTFKLFGKKMGNHL